MTTKDPDRGPVQGWDDIRTSDQYWHVTISSYGCTTCHNGLYRGLNWVLDYSEGNTFGCQVSGTGELHLDHNGRDVGVALKGLPTDQPLWGVVKIRGGWKVEANYVIPKGEAVWCAAFSLGCFWGVLHPPIGQIYPPISVSEAVAPPKRVMACKANLYSIIITKQLYTCEYTAINCTIVTLAVDRGWIPD